ncbi:MAG: hypothetical protein RTU92_01485 [Candidatus Thorarchaeota archaeon]
MSRRTIGIGFVIILSIILLGLPLIQQAVNMANTQVLYQSPEDGEYVQSGVWLCKEFIIPDTYSNYFVGADGFMLSHSYIEDQFEFEFGYGLCNRSEFIALNETEKYDIFVGYGSGGGWDESGTDFTTGHFSVDQIGTYIWAIRFIDSNTNATQFKVDFVVTLRSGW